MLVTTNSSSKVEVNFIDSLLHLTSLRPELLDFFETMDIPIERTCSIAVVKLIAFLTAFWSKIFYSPEFTGSVVPILFKPFME
jgi:hypothetical protein